MQDLTLWNFAPVRLTSSCAYGSNLLTSQPSGLHASHSCIHRNAADFPHQTWTSSNSTASVTI